MADLLGRAERSCPEAARRRVEGVGCGGERAHRAIVLVATMRGTGYAAQNVSSLSNISCRRGFAVVPA